MPPHNAHHLTWPLLAVGSACLTSACVCPQVAVKRLSVVVDAAQPGGRGRARGGRGRGGRGHAAWPDAATLQNEVGILSELSHPCAASRLPPRHLPCSVNSSPSVGRNIVPLLGSSFEGPAPCVVYALMEEGSLQDRLGCRAAGGGGGGTIAPLSAAERVRVLSDVARGLAHMHASNLVHRDVKARPETSHVCVTSTLRVSLPA